MTAAQLESGKAEEPPRRREAMAKEFRLNAFEMNCVAHQSPGLWRHPRDRSREYKRLPYWIELAQILERGLFDGLFLADVLGVYDVFGGDARAALTHAAQIPVNDPLLLVPAMAAATRHLGFGVTVQSLVRAALQFRPTRVDARPSDRRPRRLEHRHRLPRQRGARRGTRQAGRPRRSLRDRRGLHGGRLQAVGGQLGRRRGQGRRCGGVFADPDRVRKAVHDGAHFRLDALHLSEPSPQRTPVLYQAGTSPAGRAFAARHAECVFLSGPSKTLIAPRVAAIRANAAKLGRDPQGILMFALATAIVGANDAEAQAKLADYRRYADLEGALTLLSGWTGVDFSRLDPDQIVQHVDSEAGRTALENITRADPEPNLDRAAGRRACRHRRHRACVRRLAGDRSPISWRIGSTKPTSTASISPSQ